MTKRQWLLVAGTLVLAACGEGIAPCQVNDETGETYCPGPVISEPAETPAPIVTDDGSNGP
jgi:hypothetical protein